MSYGFEDIESAFGFPKPSPGAANRNKKPEKGLPWEAKTWNGRMYLPLDQVVELLKQNDVLPAVRRGLEKHLNPPEGSEK